MPKFNEYGNVADLLGTDILILKDQSTGKTKNVSVQQISDFTTLAQTENMPTTTYDPAAIEEQLVGITSAQTLTNKTFNFKSSDGSGAISLDISDAAFDNSGTGMSATNGQLALVELDGRLDTAETDIVSNTGSISTNTSNISANAANISTNTGNISTNTSSISTNASNIAANTSSISGLQSSKENKYAIDSTIVGSTPDTSSWEHNTGYIVSGGSVSFPIIITDNTNNSKETGDYFDVHVIDISNPISVGNSGSQTLHAPFVNFPTVGRWRFTKIANNLWTLG